MQLRKFIKFIYLITVAVQGYSQQLPTVGGVVGFSSPQAASIGKFGGHVINYSAGTPNINIPLVEVKEGRLSIPISLNYTYSGFRPSDQASWTGLGFSLMAGGVVTRTIKGRPDEFSGYGYLTASGRISDFVNRSSFSASAFSSNQIQNLDDTSPDNYSFQFAGYSGKFIIDDSGNGQVISAAPIKIRYEKASDTFAGNNTVIVRWIFTTPDGSNYVFQNREYTDTKLDFNLDGPNANYLPSAWYLSEIVSSNGDKVTFEYTSASTANTRMQFGRSEQFEVITPSSTGEQINQRSMYYENRSAEIYLTKIRGTSWEIGFESEQYSRLSDQMNVLLYAKKLNNIKVYDRSSGTPIQVNQISFLYTTDTGTRLHLLEVQEEGKPPYKLSYNSQASSQIVGRGANTDYWGYYNGINNQSLLPQAGADLEPREEATKIGALTKITYPTGGYTTIEYEKNVYSYTGSEVNSSTTTTEVRYKYYRRFYNQQLSRTDSSGMFVLSVPYDQRIDVKLNNNSTNAMLPACGNQGVWQTRIFQQGSYNMNQIMELFGFQPCDRQDIRATPGFDVTLEFKVFETTSSTNYVQNYGGVRVKRMADYPDPSNPNVFNATNFTYNDENYPDRSSGVIANTPFFDLTFSNVLTQYRIYRSAPFNPEALSPLYYKSVQAITSDFVTTYSYMSHSDYGDNFGKWSFLYDKGPAQGSTQPAEVFTSSNFLKIGDYGDFYFMRSMPKMITVKDLQGKIMKETIYQYSGDGGSSPIPSLHYEFLGNYNTYPDPYSNTPTNRLLFYGKAYTRVGGWPRMVSETVTDYGSNGVNAVTTSTTYSYGSVHLQPNKIRTSQSDGGVLELNTKYPLDYNPAANTPLKGMISGNMVSYPVETSTYLEKVNGSRVLVAANLTSYMAVSGNPNRSTLYLPFKQFRLNLFDGSITNLPSYNGVDDPSSTTGYQETSRIIEYDSRANPKGIIKNGLEKISFLWGYQGQYPVAEIVNADVAAVNSALSSAGTDYGNLSNSVSSSEIQARVDGVRANLPGALVTGYTYKPLVGMESMTDVAGKRTYYNYDAFERLSEIRENSATGSLFKSFHYKFANVGSVGTSISTSPNVSAITEPFITSSGDTDCNFTIAASSSLASAAVGTNIQLSATCSGTGCTAVSYSWAGTGVSNGNAQTINFNAPTAAGTYSYTVTALKTGCTQQQSSVNVTVTSSNPTQPCAVNKVRLWFRAPGDCCMDRLNGAKIQGSNNGSTWTDLYTITQNGTGSWQEFSFGNTVSYSSVRFVASSTGWGELFELEFYSGTTKLTGTPFGSAGNSSTDNFDKAFDGNTGTQWHGPTVGTANNAGLSNVGCATSCSLSVGASASASTVTTGGSVTLSASCSGSDCSGATYTWNGQGVSAQTGQTKVITVPTTAGTYSYTVTVVKGSCSQQASVNITVTSAPQTCAVNKVRLWFRAPGDCCMDRLNGAKIQGSNNGSTWTDLYTITQNGTGSWQEFSFGNTVSYSSVRFVASSTGWGELFELEFYSGTTKLTGTPFGSAGNSSTDNFDKAFDGNTGTQWHGPTVGTANNAGLSNVGCATSCSLSVGASASASTVTTGGSVTLSASCSGSDCSGATYTWNGPGVSAQTGQTKVITVPTTAGTYSYTVTVVKGSCSQQASVNITVTSAPQTCAVNKVRLWFRAPGDCCMDRLNGAKIQGSNNGSTWTDLYTITQNGTGSWQEFSFGNTVSYSSVRFVASSTGWGELFELEFYSGTTKLTGTPFGSAGNSSTDNFDKAFDGNTGTQWHGPTVGTANNAGLSNVGCATSCSLSVGASASASTVTTGGSVTLSASCSGSDCSGATYTWNGPGVSAQTGQTKVITVPTTAGTYSYTVTVVKGSCSQQASVNITVTSAPQTCAVNRVRLWFRAPGDCCMDRLNGAKIQGSNNGSTWTDLYTITQNGTGSWQEFTFGNTVSYSSVRFVASSTGWGELFELEFYSGTTKLTGTPFGSAGNSSTDNFDKAFDGNTGTQWHGPTVGTVNNAGLSNVGCATN